MAQIPLATVAEFDADECDALPGGRDCIRCFGSCRARSDCRSVRDDHDVIRATRLSGTPTETTLLYPIVVPARAHPAATAALVEPGGVKFATMTIAMPLFQRVIVAFASCLASFRLLTHHHAARPSVFAFIAPLARVPALFLAAGIARFSARRT